MKKIMRIVVALVMVVSYVAFIPSTPVSASEDVKIVYAQVPEDWTNPSVWAWGEDGTAAFEAWPGGEMMADENNEGWYYVYVPSWVTNVIINANEGSIQTADLLTNSDHAWVVVTSPEDAVLSNDQMTEGDIPEYVAMIKVNAMVPEEWLMPSVWAWSAPDGTNAFANWPGQELEQQTDGWYTYEVPAWVNSVIVNANAGSIQTSDITIESQDVWLVVTDTETVEVSYEKPEVEEEMIKVHAIVPEDWLLPSLWAWSAPDGTNVFPNWPGAELIEEGNWNTYEVPAWVNSIIINGNLGSVQTTDISVEAQDVWVVVTGPETYEVSYSEPEVTVTEVVEETTEETVEETTAEEVEKTTKVEETTKASETDNSSDDEEDDTSNSGAIAVGVIAAVALVGGGFYMVKKKK